jgi:peptidoglycan/xylan/chitin deacetylase (PgdA/CDA1 family)
MLFSLRSVARSALRAIPLPLYRAVIKRDILVFLYHLVGPPDLAHVRHLYQYKSEEAFERDLIDLARRYRMVSYEEIESRRVRPERPTAHITFDDGYAECDRLARPILQKLGIPCTFFLTTNLIDNRSMFHRNKASLCVETILSLADREASAFLRDQGRRLGQTLENREDFRRWILALGPHEESRIDETCAILQVDVLGYLRERRPYLSIGQIRRLVAEGFTIGAHAMRHVPLGSLGESAAAEEIVTSCRTIQELTGRKQVPFAFPHSADGVDRAFLRRLTSEHPVVGRLFDTHRLRRDDDIIVNRITADAPPALPGSTNLPHLLHAAYTEAASESMRRFITIRSWRQAPRGDRRDLGQG